MKNSNKIKVLFRHRSMEMGGVEKVLLSMLNNLDKDKFDFTLCLNLNQGELRNQVPSHVRKVALTDGKEDFSTNPILFKFQLLFRKIKLEFYRKFPKYVDNKILKDQYDIEIAASYTAYHDVLYSSNKNSKKVGWFHSDITSPGFQPILDNLLKQISQFDYFIFGSQQSQTIFKETYPQYELPQHQTVINAIPINEIKTLSDQNPDIFGDKKTPIFISVGRLHNRKGYHVLATAHKKLLTDGYKHEIYIIGDGEELLNLQNQIKELDITNSFHLLGTKLNPYPYVRNADYYIMPSRSEGWPLIIAETLILQKPIIATSVGGIPEMINHKENGFLVDYSVEGIYNGMKEFLTNNDLVNKIKLNLQYSEKQFDNQKIFDTVEKILTKTSQK